MYFPLYKLPHAEMLLQRRWTKSASSVVRQQLKEPFEEARDYAKIPTLTSIDDAISLKVMRQYEENPFPRWTVEPAVPAIGEASLVQAELAIPSVILIAGSGSGRHAYQVANQFPKSRILAVDISIPSLAYSRRKMRENSVHNVDFAQADILKIGDIGRTFDRIEVVGVLHHLEDPEAGLRILLSLLRPGGEMRIGLYSERARAKIIEARAMIAARGYRPTAEDIRRCRQEILQNDQACDWTEITSNEGFYSITGCRDFLFNVMEHRFTIPKIAKLLNRYHLSFLGSNPPQKVLESFMAYYPASALTDLQCWNDFEVAHPLAFRHMYVFTIRKPL